MSKMNPDLLAKVTKKLGVTKARVYALIQKKASHLHVPGHVALLALASEYGISIQRYATTDDYTALQAGSGAVKAHVAASPPAQPRVAAASRASAKKQSPKNKVTKTNTVFVVHGRDSVLTEDMYGLLMALGLNVQEWRHAVAGATSGTGNPYTNNVVTRIMKKAQAIVVMLTPDDNAKLSRKLCRQTELGTEGKLRGQPRANVLFELGIAIGTYPRKTLVLKVGDPKRPSDIDGMHLVDLTGGNIKGRRDLAMRLQKLGCKVDESGDKWLTTGTFALARKPSKKGG